MPSALSLPLTFSLENITRLSTRGIRGMTVDRHAVVEVRIAPSIPSPERGFILDPASEWLPAPGEVLWIGHGETYLAALPVPKGEFVPILPLPVLPRIMAKGLGLGVTTMPNGKVVRHCAIDTSFDRAIHDGFVTVHFHDNDFAKVERAFEKLNDKALAKLGKFEWLEEHNPEAIEEADRYMFEVTDVTGEKRLLERYLDDGIASCAAVVLQLSPRD
ncbi:MAG: hypothetical protein ACKO56_11475 [Paracoccaceae bacterium]